jgi:hypothetical protein
MELLKVLSKPAAWASGWTSAVLCLSAATGYWLAGEHKRTICWGALGAVEVAAIVHTAAFCRSLWWWKG